MWASLRFSVTVLVFFQYKEVSKGVESIFKGVIKNCLLI